MRLRTLLLLVVAAVLVAKLSLADSIDYQAAGSVTAGTAFQFGSIRSGHVWEVVDQLIEIDNLTTGVIQQGILGWVDVTSGSLVHCAEGLCFHGGTLDIDGLDNHSIFDSPLAGGSISLVNGTAILVARLGGRVATTVIRDNGNDFSTQTLVRSTVTVPEPSSLLLIGSGVLGLALLGKRHCFGR